MALYFCCMAAFAWWACLALAWFLAAGLKWGHEAIENKSHLFHLVAWSIPALQTICVLALGKVEGKTIHFIFWLLFLNLDYYENYAYSNKQMVIRKKTENIKFPRKKFIAFFVFGFPFYKSKVFFSLPVIAAVSIAKLYHFVEQQKQLTKMLEAIVLNNCLRIES